MFLVIIYTYNAYQLTTEPTANQQLASMKYIGVARGGQGRAFARPSLNFALPSKVAKQVN